MIGVTDVTVELGDVTALEDVSLAVDEGEFLAVVGPNGAGKTTLLRTINGVLTADAGRVTVDGRDVAALSARAIARRVATVPQATTLGFDFAVRDVVAMGRTPHRSRLATTRPVDRDVVDRALERTDTARFADRSIDELSGGERQRVLLARALAQETPVLLLDEPTANLDINHQVRTLSLAAELAAEGRTVVAAIHDLGLAARFCHAVALVADGRLVAEGTPTEVLTAERLEQAFDIRTAVTTNPVTGTPTVTPLADAAREGPRVHVVGGGVRAARVIGALATAGFAVSAGVLPADDIAAETARGVGADLVTAPAFEAVPDGAVASARTLCDAAAVTVLAGPIAAPNRRLVSESDRLVAIEGVDAPPATETVPERDLVATVRAHAAAASPPSQS